MNSTWRATISVTLLALLLVCNAADLLLAAAEDEGCDSSCCATAQSGGVAAQTCCDTQCQHPTNFSLEKQTSIAVLPGLSASPLPDVPTTGFHAAEKASPPVLSASPLYLRTKALLI